MLWLVVGSEGASRGECLWNPVAGLVVERALPSLGSTTDRWDESGGTGEPGGPQSTPSPTEMPSTAWISGKDPDSSSSKSLM